MQLRHLRDAKQELQRREARRRWADGALAALPTTEATTGGALNAADLALGGGDDAEEQDTSRGAVAGDSDSASSDGHGEDEGAPSPRDVDQLSRLDVDAVGAGDSNSMASADKSFERGVKAGAALASLDAALLFPGGSSDRHGSGAHTSQLGFRDDGSARHSSPSNHPQDRGPAAMARAADPAVEEEVAEEEDVADNESEEKVSGRKRRFVGKVVKKVVMPWKKWSSL